MSAVASRQTKFIVMKLSYGQNPRRPWQRYAARFDDVVTGTRKVGRCEKRLLQAQLHIRLSKFMAEDCKRL